MSAGAQGYVLKPSGAGKQLFETIAKSTTLGGGAAHASRRRTKSTASFDAHRQTHRGLGAKRRRRTAPSPSTSRCCYKEVTRASVVLVDADFLAGDAGDHLAMAPSGPSDLVPHIDGSIRAWSSRSWTPSGWLARAGSADASRCRPKCSPPSTCARPQLARQMYDDVVIDTQLPIRNDRMLSVLDLADMYMSGAHAAPGAPLRSARHFIEVARKLAYPTTHDFVLNRASNLPGLTWTISRRARTRASFRSDRWSGGHPGR